MKVLVIGSGGREHALAWKLKQSPKVKKIFVAPGNGGTGEMAENVPIKASEFRKLALFARDNNIDRTIVSQDDALAQGIVDTFKDHNLWIFGPSAGAARLEASKAFAKRLMRLINIPTALPFKIFHDYQQAVAYVWRRKMPLVIKPDGLTGGKGVKQFRDPYLAERYLFDLMCKKIYNAAGEQVVIEKFLTGQEVSIHAFSDGCNFRLFPASQDHKALYDNDKGPNTGGMGAIAPVPWLTEKMMAQVGQTVVKPVLDYLADKSTPFVGCLYPGLKILRRGVFKVLEFNARFGDPETQVYSRLLKTDLLDILGACVDGRLADQPIEWHDGFAACVAMVSDGYGFQTDFKTGYPIYGLEEAKLVEGVEIFHGGTIHDQGLKTAGGRVLYLTATGETLRLALARAYQAVGLINFQGRHYRMDIGKKSLKSFMAEETK